jgi:hypothetical protein
MQVMVNKNIPVYVNAGGFKQKYVQDIAEDIGGMILKAFRAGNNNSMDDTVTVCFAIHERIDLMGYNPIIADQIAHQMLEYCDTKFGDTVISDEDMHHLQTHYLHLQDCDFPQVTIN